MAGLARSPQAVTRLPAEHAGLRLLPVPAARYDEARRPSSRPDRSVCDPSGGGSATMMARVRNVGMKRGRLWAKELELLGVGLDFIPVFMPSRQAPFAAE